MQYYYLSLKKNAKTIDFKELLQTCIEHFAVEKQTCRWIIIGQVLLDM